MQQHASGCADPGQLGDRIYGVDHVAGGDDGNAAGVFGQDGRELLGPNLSEAVGTKPTDADPPRLFEASDRFQNRFVLDRRGDDVTWAVAAAGQPGDGQVVGLGGRRGEDDRAAATADRFGNRLPRLLDGLAGSAAENVRAGRVAELLPQERQHGVEDGLVHLRCRIIVQIDDAVHVKRSARSNNTRHSGSPRIVTRGKPACFANDPISAAS